MKVLETRVTSVEKQLDMMNNRISDLQTVVYWGFAIITLVIAFAALFTPITEFLKNLRKPSLTIEEVEQLINRKLENINLGR